MKPLHVLVFGSGAILMALEVLGSRLMAPHFGNSVYVWGSLISVFLMALSIGYYLGGNLADARPRQDTLTLVLAAAGAFTSFIPALAESIARTFSGWGPRAGTLAAATVIFLPPTILIGMVSPLAVRLGVPDLARLGQASGRLYAVSTAGSIAGTLVTTFFLVPLAGTKLLITVLAAGLFVLTAISLLAERKRAWAVAAASFGLFLTLWGPTGALAGRLALGPGFGVLQTVFATESAYHNIRVMDGNGVRYLRFDNSWQSGMDKADPFESSIAYPDYFHLAMAQNPAIRDVLVVGLGGAAAPKKFWRDYPSVSVDVIELDPQVVDVARRFFALPEDERLRVVVGDGRRYLETNRKQYDLIILDAYYSDSIPFHLTTREFIRSLKLRLKPGGLAAFNLIGALEGPQSSFFRAMYKTVTEGFPTRYVVPVDWREHASRREKRNIILFATESEAIDPKQFRENARAASGRIRVKDLASFAEALYEAPVPTDDVSELTDDHAPVDNLIRVMD